MNNNILIIVESPGKINKIKEYLGDGYIIKASCGHIRDLNKDKINIDIENNFLPNYTINSDKAVLVKELKKLSKECQDTILASDGDREGEAIAYSLSVVLKLKNPKRVIFNEITEDIIKNAIKNPIKINRNIVYAQQTRRILDRLIGYKISPLLCNLLQSSQSVGRVQSVVLNIIIDKENEIKKFNSTSKYNTSFDFIIQNNNIVTGYLDVNLDNNIHEFINKINKNTVFKIIATITKNSYKSPCYPLITSTLQQLSYTMLHFNIKKTMQIAQKLYEKGYITYIRTDSFNINENIKNNISQYIIKTFGEEYSDPKNFVSNNNKEAHECIRPTKIAVKNIDSSNNDENKLYNLIWNRTIECQMSKMKMKNKIISVDAVNEKSILLFDNEYKYIIINIDIIEFLGFKILYNDVIDNKNTDIETVNFKKLYIHQIYTSPPLRYNEAGLIKYLDKHGIGRPSTYESTITKLLDRKYIESSDIKGVSNSLKCYELDNTYKLYEYIKESISGNENKKFTSTDIGNTINSFMINNFSSIINIAYTSEFEKYLDKISLGDINWVEVITKLYNEFNNIILKLNIDKVFNSKTDKKLGNINNIDIFTGSGKYGPYIKSYIDNKWKYVSIKNIDKDKLTLEYSNELLSFPITLGKLNRKNVLLCKGIYGFYLSFNNKNFNIKDKEYKHIDISYAKNLIENI